MMTDCCSLFDFLCNFTSYCLPTILVQSHSQWFRTFKWKTTTKKFKFTSGGCGVRTNHRGAFLSLAKVALFWKISKLFSLTTRIETQWIYLLRVRARAANNFQIFIIQTRQLLFFRNSTLFLLFFIHTHEKERKKKTKLTRRMRLNTENQVSKRATNKTIRTYRIVSYMKKNMNKRRSMK